MRKVGVFEAKTHLSALLDAVERGEEIIITRRGKPVGRLVADDGTTKNREAAFKAADRIRQRAKHMTLGPGLTICQLIDEGRE
jgi:prevent-host-death family protein